MKRLQEQIATVVDTMEELTESRGQLEKDIENQMDIIIAAVMQRKLDLKQELNSTIQQKMVKLLKQKRSLQDTQRDLEECYMLNDSTFEGVDRKNKIMANVEDAESFQVATTGKVTLQIKVDEMTKSITSLGSITSVEPPPKVLRGLSTVNAYEPEAPTPRRTNENTALEERFLIVSGYIRQVLPHLQAPFEKIPSSVSLLVLDFYYQSQLDGVLGDPELKALSIDLVNRSDYEFMNFVEKVLQSRLREQIWKKCDETNSGTIDERRFMYFWIIPVTLFKVAEYQKENNTKEKPELDNSEIKRECKHLASWIIWRYGKLEDGRFTFKLEEKEYEEKVMDYLQSYVDAQGRVNDRYDNI